MDPLVHRAQADVVDQGDAVGKRALEQQPIDVDQSVAAEPQAQECARAPVERLVGDQFDALKEPALLEQAV